MASTASAAESTRSAASGSPAAQRGGDVGGGAASGGGMEELLPLVMQLTNAEQVRVFACVGFLLSRFISVGPLFRFLFLLPVGTFVVGRRRETPAI